MPRAQSSSEKEVSGAVGAVGRLPARRVTGGRLAVVLLLAVGVATLRVPAPLMASSDGRDGAPAEPAQHATLKPAASASPDIPLAQFDPEAEHVLLDLANQARAQTHLPALMLDAALSRAAHAHAQAMVQAQQLSHQFEGELSLPQRLAAVSTTLLDQEGENVAFDFDAENGHEHLMQSPPHRANLLNANYNVVGLAVARGADGIYIVQDFGHALPAYSTAEIRDRVAATVQQARHQARLSELTRQDLPVADDAACSMARADKLGTSAIHQLSQRYTVLTYTSVHPEIVPADGAHALSSRNLRRFSVGACYARSDTYPTGVYWIVLSLQ
jgi:uncharacterized protein YkwD